jgi:S1-C subfamily serine protease
VWGRSTFHPTTPEQGCNVRAPTSCFGIIGTVVAVFTASLAAPTIAAPSEDELNTISVFRNTSRGVAHVTATAAQAPEGDKGRAGVGTGFVLDQVGHLITAHHVVKDRKTIVVTLPTGEDFVASIVGSSDEFDVALLRIGAPRELLFPLRLGDSTQVQVGQKVMAIGNGYGLHNSLSVGVVSALGRTLRGSATELESSFIQTDAAINPGNSGGPLLNSDGEVIGINDAMNPNAQSIGFAIPIHLVRSVLPDLVRMGHIFRPALGFSGTMLRVAGGAPVGFAVQEVVDGSPAARSGLRAPGRIAAATGESEEPGDIIVKVNRQRVTNPGDISRAVVMSAPGQVIEFEVRRGSRSLVIRLTLPEMQHP